MSVALDQQDRSTTAGRDLAAAARPRDWQTTYARTLLGVDVLAIAAASLAAVVLRFGGEPARLVGLSYDVVPAVITPLWLLSLAASRAYENRYLGVGSEEFKRVFNASVRLTAVVATIAYAAKVDLARGYVAVALPLGTALLLVGRFAARKVLHARRKAGRACHRVLVVGAREPALELVAQFERNRYAGFTVVAACLPGDADSPLPVAGGTVPVLDTLAAVPDAVCASAADTVAVTGSSGVSSESLRRLSWQLEGNGVALVIAPALANVAGPRIHIRPVAGLPLLHVEEPELSGARQLLKDVVERSTAAVALLLLFPFLALIGLVIRASSPGPALFRQVRVGKTAQPFRLVKFRSMTDGAELLRTDLVGANEADGGMLFKIRRDPRVTRVGRWLRRYSLDELPQLVNVVRGEMSLVGPRPPLPAEVASYGLDAQRRLLVKPGMTGLWQVNGRSDLSWEESVRLDLFYVENWSPALDLMILWKTAAAVLRSRGAY